MSVDTAINDRVAEDLGSAEGISLPITLLLMLLAFGALIAAGVPVLLAITSVAATMGIAAPLSHLIHAEPTVTSLIVLIGMAVGVDYSLFYLKREREERAKGAHHPRRRRDRRGHLGPLDPGLGCGRGRVHGRPLHRRAARPSPRSPPASIVVVVVAVIGSVTVLPALLVKLGRWVDRPAHPAAVAGQPPDRSGRHQPSHPGPRRTPSRRGAGRLAGRAGRPGGSGARDEDPRRQPRHPARRRSPRCRPCTRSPTSSPAEGATATVVVHGTAAQHDQVVAGDASARVVDGVDGLVRRRPVPTRSRPRPTARPCG